nr:glycosyltransferase [uncultured Pseudomonas sp.]
MGDTSASGKVVAEDVTVVVLDPQVVDRRLRAAHFYAVKGIRCVFAPCGESGLQPDHLLSTLKQLETPYVVLTCGSDFVFPEMLSVAQGLLSQSPEMQMVQGYSLGYQARNCSVRYYRLPQASVVHSGMDARERIACFANGNLQAWRAVMRRETLESALGLLPTGMTIDAWLVALSYALLTASQVGLIDCTSGLVECSQTSFDLAARDQEVADLVREIRQWDADTQGVCHDDEDYLLLRAFVDQTYPGAKSDVLFTSAWRQDASQPEREFERRQFVELPYYSARVSANLTAAEFLLHAWPTDTAHIRALEGGWVQTHQLLQPQPHDTTQSVLNRLWQAYQLNPFNVSVCRRLLEWSGSSEDLQRVSSLNAWLARLVELPPLDTDRLLKSTPSGKALATIEAEVPDNNTREHIARYLANNRSGEITIVVLDTHNNNDLLQQTFDSILVSGVQSFRIVVLKIGKLPAITTPRDTLHFIKVSADNKLSHLNLLMREASSEWVLLLEAGDLLCTGGGLRLQIELAAGSECMAIASNDVQRDEEGLLFGIERPGADLDLLRSRPDAMSKHWVVRRTAVLEIGGYSEQYPEAYEFDLLLRLVERYGLGSLAHMDTYLVLGRKPAITLKTEAVTCLNRHLGQLGYSGQVSDQGEGHLTIEFRHATTPLVSILICVGNDRAGLQELLDSVFQRTRYPRIEVLLVCAEDAREYCAEQLRGYTSKVRMITSPRGASQTEMFNRAVSQATGEYFVLLSSRCLVLTPTWLEVMLNHAERPEVGVVGARLVDVKGRVTHAGYQLMDGGGVSAPWLGLSGTSLGDELGMREVRKCQAVDSDGMMIRRDVFERCGPLRPVGVASIDFCLRVASEGLLVLSIPDAQLINETIALPSQEQVKAVFAVWPVMFGGQGRNSWFDNIDC